MTEETIEREIHSSEGGKIKIKSKRGTGTRDQDEVTVELSGTDPMDMTMIRQLAVEERNQAMNDLRNEQETEGE